ncbi:MAG: filamentous hemagglutinin N-terminal domain-containing protein, partial [Verrucomicrobiae bacterium]|nr:filamentous hemagglutinin N-terminal domain-containing protein [Verrucomicrobiae bacterium]
MKNLLKRLRLSTAFQAAVVSVLAPALLLLPVPGWSNPAGGVVTHGAAEINAELAGHLKVFQQSNRAIINWESFSINAGEITEFIQPSASAVALSRVIGGNPSAIYGTLKANGGHILINQNGILVGPGGVVDVGGLNVLSTLDIDDNNFMAVGNMVFSGSTAAGVTNFGTISSAGRSEE